MKYILALVATLSLAACSFTDYDSAERPTVDEFAAALADAELGTLTDEEGVRCIAGVIVNSELSNNYVAELAENPDATMVFGNFAPEDEEIFEGLFDAMSDCTTVSF